MSVVPLDAFASCFHEGVVQPDNVESYEVGGKVPTVVLHPSNETEVASALSVASEHGLVIVPWGGGTLMGLGNPPLSLDVVMSLSGLDAMVEHQPNNLTATAQAGISIARLQDTLAVEGQMLPLDPPLPERATLGGTLAADRRGISQMFYGELRHLVLETRVAHPDGTVTKAGGKVVKNVTGYDLNKLYVGSLGTLGIFTEVTIRVALIPSTEKTVVIPCRDIQTALKSSVGVLSTGIGVRSLAILNAGIAGRLGHVPQGALLVIAVSGRINGVERRVDEIIRICRQEGGTNLDTLNKESSDVLWHVIRDLELNKISDAPQLVIASHVGTSDIVPLWEAVETVAKYFSVDVEISYKASSAGGTMRSVWVMGGSDVSPSFVTELVGRIRDVARALEIDAIVEDCPSSMKEHFDVWGVVSDQSLLIMSRLKDQFDPQRILNPGRFVGGI